MFPKKASFKLKATGKTYTLREITLDDQVWIKEEYGDRLEEIFSPPMDLNEVCRIVYRLIVNKGDFKAVEINDYDDEGNFISTMCGGYKLLRRMIAGDEIVDFIWAFNECQGLSRPVEPKENKKKVTKKVKKKATKKKATKKK